jgi:hypothetical protein
MTPSMIFSLLSLILCFFSFFFFRFYIKRRTSQEQILRDIREGVDKILTEIDRITDEDILLIEEREHKLKGIIEEADRRMKVYAEHLSRRWSAAEAYAELGRNRGRTRRESPPDSAGEAPAGAVVPGSSPGTAEAPGGTAALSAQASPENAAYPVSARGPEAPAPESPPRSLGERVRELAGFGLSARVIASRLGVSIAEAELALALQEPKKPV